MSVAQTCPKHGTPMDLMYALTPQHNVLAAATADATRMKGFLWHTAAEMRDE